MGRRLKRMQEGVDEVISLINSRHGVREESEAALAAWAKKKGMKIV